MESHGVSLSEVAEIVQLVVITLEILHLVMLPLHNRNNRRRRSREYRRGRTRGGRTPERRSGSPTHWLYRPKRLPRQSRNVRRD